MVLDLQTGSELSDTCSTDSDSSDYDDSHSANDDTMNIDESIQSDKFDPESE